jgi:hypothetical protein
LRARIGLITEGKYGYLLDIGYVNPSQTRP